MKIQVFDVAAAMGQAAAAHAAQRLRERIDGHGRARVVAATGTAQFPFLAPLTSASGIDWSKVELFHLDEYVGIPPTHPASFRRFLTERLIKPTGLTNAHLLDGEADAAKVCREVGAAVQAAPIDIAFVGIGENAHLAFNDPPADFATYRPFIVVNLDEACRQQQVDEGWFETIDDVPRRAISMSIRQILAAREILVIVPDERKAEAVRRAIEGPVTPNVPASILREHPAVTLFLDRSSASLLSPDTIARLAPNEMQR